MFAAVPSARRIVLIASVLVLSAGLLAGVVFLTPLPGTLLLRSAVALLEREYGVTATAGRLDVDVARLLLEVEDLKLAALSHTAEPFLAIDRAVVDLGWPAFRGDGVPIDGVSLRGMAVTVTRHPDGTSNLPVPRPGAGSGEGSAGPRSVQVGRFDLQDLTVDWRDAQQDLTLHLPPTSLRLPAGAGPAGAARGPLAMEGTARIAWRGTTLEVSRLDGDIGFDGAALDIERLEVVAAAEGELTLSGRVEDVLVDPRAGFRYAAQIDLAHASRRSDASASGSMAATGDVEWSRSGLTATATMSAPDAAWNGLHVDRVDAGFTLTPGEARLDSLRMEAAAGVLTAAGSVTLTPERTGHLQAAWNGLDLGQLPERLRETSAALPRATAEGALSAEWDALDFRSLTLAAENRLVDGPGASGGLRLDAAGGAWRLTLDQRFDAGAHLSGSIDGEFAAGADMGGGTWRDTAFAGALTVRCADLDRCSRLVPALADRGVRLAPLPVTDLETRIDLDRDGLRIGDLRFAVGTNTVTGDGSIRWKDGSIDGTLVAAVPDLSTVAPEAAAPWSPTGRGRIEVEARGSLDRLAADATFAFDDVSVAGRSLGVLVGGARFDSAEGVQVDSRLPDLAATVEASLDLTGERAFEVRGSMSRSELARLLPPDVPVSGRVTLEAAAAGTLAAPAATRGQLTMTALAGTAADLEFGLVRPATVHYGPDGLHVDGLAARLGNARLRVDGGLAPSGGAALRARLDGAASDLARMATVALGRDLPAPVTGAAGEVAVGLTATGSPGAFELTGELRIDGGALAFGDLAPITDLTLRAELDEAGLHLDTLRAAWAGAVLEGSADVPLELVLDRLAGRLVARDRPGRIRARIDGIGPGALAGHLVPESLAAIDGHASVDVDLELPALDPAAARGRVTLPEAAFVASGVPFAQRRPTEIVIEAGRATIAAFAWGNETTEIRAGGGVELGDAPTARVTLDGELDLRAAGALLPPLAAAGIATAGSAELSAVVSGSATAPQVQGTVQVVGAEVRLPEPRLSVTDLDGTLLLAGNSVTVQDLAGSANGGRIAIAGGWTLGGDPAGNGFTLTGEGLALDVPSGLRSEADVALRAAETDGDVTLSGTVTLLRGAYREPITLAGGLLDVLRQRRDAAAVRLEDASSGAVRLDVHVATVEDVVVDNNYLDAELGGNLRIGGSPGAPTVTGRVAMREGGRIRFGNRVYEIDVGAVDLVDPDGIAPDVTLSARTRAGSYEITLEASGGRDELTTTLRSEPPLPESDIVSLLLTGRRLDQAAAPSAAARDQALGLVTTEILGQAGRRVGLDLQVESEAAQAQGAVRLDSTLIAADLNPGSRFTVGRNLREDVRLVVSRSLRSNDLAWLVDYLPADNLELRALFDDEAARAYELRHAMTAGAPPATAAAAGQAPRLPARVSAIDFDGDGGADAVRLRELLSLRAGDRFDFHRWQRDVDRLEAFFLARGFLEARVRARRDRPAGSNDVALTYEIARGPRTELAVTGYALPDDVRHDLETIWTRTVFDTFLIEELSARVARHLAERGHLRARVDVRVEEGAREGEASGEGAASAPGAAEGIAAKRIDIRIEAGDRTDDRRIVFEGVAAEEEAQLQALAASPDLATRAWTDPDRLAAAVTDWYRGRGRLRATAAAWAPRFDGASAVLPVRVTAGPVYRVGAVRTEGAGAREPAEVLAAASIAAGAVYTENAVAAARARIESSYRRTGYTSARVVARSTPDDAAATVAVRFDIVEGPRRVVEAIVVDGAARTSPGLVARALRIAPGNPVDPGAWNLARKRLYDTGVFRSVDIEARAVEAAGAGGARGTVPVEARVTLEEWPPYLFRYGLRLTDEVAALGETTGRILRIGAAADFRRRNLLGHGLTAGISSVADRRRQAVRTYLTIPTLFGRSIETNLFASRKRQVTGAQATGFMTDIDSFTAEQRLRPLDRLTLAYSANLDLNHTFDRTPDPAFPFDVRLRVLRFDVSAVAERRDDLFDATDGSYHSANLEYGADVGRPVRFLKYLGQHFLYRRIGRVVLASAARVGLATGFGSDLIPTERFFAGGGNTVRGYAQDGLGPAGLLGAPAGGSALLVLNQEARFPLGRRLAGVGFVDAGSVFRSVGAVALRDLRLGAGLGLRIDTPAGLVRIDYGIPLTRGPDDPRGRAFVSLGQAF